MRGVESGSRGSDARTKEHMFKVKVFFLNLAKRMWPKVTAYALFGIASAFLSVLFRDRVPDTIAYSVSSETVGTILTILASSMLAVTTFSLTVMVSAYSSATAVSPRATQLVIADHTAQNVLATFIGTFLFSLVGIIALNAEVYQDKGRVVLFGTTLLVIAIMIVTLIRWIDKLTTIGRYGETTKLVEQAASKALRARAEAPCLGCNKYDFTEISPHGRIGVPACSYGYVQYVDIDDLSRMADQLECDIYVTAMPGTFVTPNTALVETCTVVDNEAAKLIRKEFTISDQRAFEQDPRFGICVLAEIAQRALPPAIDDSGTAIDVLGRLVAVLAAYAGPKKESIKCRRVWVPPLSVGDLYADAFDAISRNGASIKQVHMTLHKYLRHLNELDDDEFRNYALLYSRLAIRHSDASRLLDSEKEELRKIALIAP